MGWWKNEWNDDMEETPMNGKKQQKKKKLMWADGWVCVYVYKIKNIFFYKKNYLKMISFNNSN